MFIHVNTKSLVILLTFSILALLAAQGCSSAPNHAAISSPPANPSPASNIAPPKTAPSGVGNQPTEPASTSAVSEVQFSLTKTQDYTVEKLSGNQYRTAIKLPAISYQVFKQDQYDLLAIEDAQPNQSPGAPVLPIVELLRLNLPPTGRVTAARLNQGQAKPVGNYNVPTIEVKPFSKGGISYVDLPSEDRFLPAEDDLLSYQELTQNEWLFLFSPFQYNPQTHEVQLWDSGEAVIEYTLATLIVPGELKINPEIIESGEVMHIEIPIRNLGTEPQTIIATISLIDPGGTAHATSVSPPIEVSASSENLLEGSWQPELQPGAWNVLLNITDLNGRLLNASTASIQVR